MLNADFAIFGADHGVAHYAQNLLAASEMLRIMTLTEPQTPYHIGVTCPNHDEIEDGYCHLYAHEGVRHEHCRRAVDAIVVRDAKHLAAIFDAAISSPLVSGTDLPTCDEAETAAQHPALGYDDLLDDMTEALGYTAPFDVYGLDSTTRGEIATGTE